MKRTPSDTTPGEVISPLPHSKDDERITTPGQQFPSSTKPLPDEESSEKKAKEKLARPPSDHTEVTIGPTTGTIGQDVNLT